MNTKVVNLCLLIALNSIIYAQASSNTSANVCVKLIKPIGVFLESGNLDFGERFLSGEEVTVSKEAKDGAKFKVTGSPNKWVTLDYNNSIQINNNDWIASNGGESGSINFIPQVYQTGEKNIWESPVLALNGQTCPLGNISGVGTLFVWVGGDIEIKSNQPQGDYTGTFVISVSY